MKYLLLTLALLVSISASALKIELREIDFSRCPEIKQQLVEIMKTIDSDRRRVGKKFNMKGSNYYFVTINGIDINDLYFCIKWYESKYYMDYAVKYSSDFNDKSLVVRNYDGYTVIGNDTLLVTIGDLADSIIDRIGFYKKKTKIPFVNFPPRYLAIKIDFKKIIWKRSDEEGKVIYTYTLNENMIYE